MGLERAFYAAAGESERIKTMRALHDSRLADCLTPAFQTDF